MKAKRFILWGFAFSLATTVLGQGGTDITPDGMKFATAPELTVVDFDVKAPFGGNPTIANATEPMKANGRFFFWGMGAVKPLPTKEAMPAIINYRNVEGYGRMLNYDSEEWVKSGIANIDKTWAGLSVFSPLTLPNLVSAGAKGFATATDQQKIDATTRVSILFRCRLDPAWFDESGYLLEGKETTEVLNCTVQSSQTVILGTASSVQALVFLDEEYNEETFTTGYRYNPNKWVRLSWDIMLSGKEGAPLYLKNGFTVSNLATTSVDIKEITFTQGPSDAAKQETISGKTINAVQKTELITPTSIGSLSAENGLKVTFANEKVEVHNVPMGEVITINSFTGALVQQVISSGDLTSISLSKGIYVLVAGGKSAKIVL